jgi:hypothetical protein
MPKAHRIPCDYIPRPLPDASSPPRRPSRPATPDQPKPAQANTAAVLEAPTFKIRTDLVLVPVVVRDHKGNHIPGLTQDAFHLEENGKDQTISLFEEIHAATNAPPPAPILDRGYSNLPFDNASELRLTIIVLDLLNTTPLQRTDGKDQLIKFLLQRSGAESARLPALPHQPRPPVGASVYHRYKLADPGAQKAAARPT